MADDKMKLSFEDIGSWAQDLGSAAAPSHHESEAEDVVRQTISGIEIGNLAALEESTDDGARRDLPTANTPSAPSATAPSETGPRSNRNASAIATVPPVAKTKSGSAIKAAVVVLVLAAITAGLWFAGVIPH
jgi:hypothetical protein